MYRGSAINLFAGQAARWMLVAAAFSLVLPTAWISLFLLLFTACWILSGNFASKWSRVRAHPAAMAAMALFALYGVGAVYSVASWQEAIAFWGKYHKLLYIPIIVSLLDDPLWRRRAAAAFFWGMLLVLAISWLKWLGWVPHTDIGQGYIVFKGRIAHNIFMAFTFYLALQRAHQGEPRCWLWAGVALLAAANILFLVNGRTGQLLLPVMLLFFAAQHWGWRGAATAAASMAALATAFALFFGPERLQQMRLYQVQQEIEAHQHDGPAQTSSGQRLEFYENTLAIAAERPFFGWGTGSFQTVYAWYAQRNSFATVTANPHNEYLLIAQQLGLAGLAMLLGMGWLTWRAANRLAADDAERLRALVLLIGMGALFNSLLLDAGEGKFFCLMAGIYLSGWSVPGSRE